MRRFWLVAAGAMAALGALLCVVFTPMRFCGQLLLAGAAAVLIWGVSERWREKRPVRIARRVAAGVVAAGLVIFVALEVQIVRYGRSDEETPVAAVVVLGAGVNGTVPSLSLRVRLEAALRYAAERPGIPIVVTGGQGPGEEITEARCMADWLVEQGVAPDRIVLEEKAVNTEENVLFSKELLEAQGVDLTDSVAVVSADYHLYRASLYWGTGMVPVAASMPPGYLGLTVNYYVREAFGVAAVITGLDGWLSTWKR